MIDVKQAVEAAVKAAQEFYADKELVDLGLEEVELSEDQVYWRITLGFYLPNLNPTRSIATMLEGQPKYERKYKVFKIDVNTGRVLSMKMHKT